MSYSEHKSFTTKSGCTLIVWENKDEPFSQDGIFLGMKVDTRYAELMLDPDDARKLSRMLYPPRVVSRDEQLILARDAVLEHRLDLNGRCMCGKFVSNDPEKIAMHLVLAVVEELYA